MHAIDFTGKACWFVEVSLLLCLLAAVADATHAQQFRQGGRATIRGRVLKSDIEAVGGQLVPIPDDDLRIVRAVRANDSNVYVATLLGSGNYIINVPRDMSVWTIQYRARGRHPGVVENVSVQSRTGGDAAAIINKVLFPYTGPKKFSRNMSQLLEYEKIWYFEVGRGTPVQRLVNDHSAGLLQMPLLTDRIAFPDLWEPNALAQTRRQLLFAKKAQVFNLYQTYMREPYFEPYMPFSNSTIDPSMPVDAFPAPAPAFDDSYPMAPGAPAPAPYFEEPGGPLDPSGQYPSDDSLDYQEAAPAPAPAGFDN
jgi:hypothetical protein